MRFHTALAAAPRGDSLSSDLPKPVTRETIPAAPQSPSKPHSSMQTCRRLMLLWGVLGGLCITGHTLADEIVGEQSAKEPAVAVQLVQRSTHALPQRPAPELQVAAWVDQSGPATPPQLQGKVRLVVFWGVNCPACVRKLPQLRAAATRYAGSDLVVIGLHNAQISPARAAKFARERALNYPIAIDRTGRTRYSFGATTSAYKVQAIPHAAVIDRDGTLKFVGRFEQALQTAEQLVSVPAG